MYCFTDQVAAKNMQMQACAIVWQSLERMLVWFFNNFLQKSTNGEVNGQMTCAYDIYIFLFAWFGYPSPDTSTLEHCLPCCF